MEVKFDMDEEIIARAAKRQTEMAAGLLVRQMISQPKLEGDAKEAVRDLIFSHDNEIISMAARQVKDEIKAGALIHTNSAYQAIKEIIYSQKAEIIEEVTKRATKEIVRRGLRDAYVGVVTALTAERAETEE